MDEPQHTNEHDPGRGHDPARELIEPSPDRGDVLAASSGAVTGAAIGAVTGGPPGAVAGAAAGTLRGVAAKKLTEGIEDRSDRKLNEKLDELGVGDGVPSPRDASGA